MICYCINLEISIYFLDMFINEYKEEDRVSGLNWYVSLIIYGLCNCLEVKKNFCVF